MVYGNISCCYFVIMINQFFTLSRRYLRIYFTISITVFLFILFFQPFHTLLAEFETRLLYYAGFGLISFLLLLILQIVFQASLPEHETVMPGSSLMSSLYHFSFVVTTSIAFVFYIRYVGHFPVRFITVIRVILIVAGMAVWLIVYNKMIFLRYQNAKLLLENNRYEDRLKEYSDSSLQQTVELNSDNESDKFIVRVMDIVFLRSADNYIELCYMEGEDIRKKMIRSTLKHAEQQLSTFNSFIRTHRTSLVNLRHIEKLHKNFNTHWLSLISTKETIPVSRQYLMTVKELLR